MGVKNVHYFPGHMNKALSSISTYAKMVDLIIEIVDSRAPLSSQNPLLEELISHKKKVILLSKTDYSDPSITKRWISYYETQGILATEANLKKSGIVSLLNKLCEKALKDKREKEKRIGMKPQPIKAMVVGIPNVGKSTLINNLHGHKSAPVGNKAGITKATQWIKLNENFILLDTPGVLPMNYPDGAMAVRLAILGSMREDVLPTEELAIALLGFLKENYDDALNKRFGIESIKDLETFEILTLIAKKRGFLENGSYSESRAAYALIKEYKDGLLGPYSLEFPPLC